MTSKKPVSKWLVIGIVAVVLLVIAGIGFSVLKNRHDIGSTRTGRDGMTLLYVPAGEFTMGSNDYPEEQPIQKVNLDAFWIDQLEVTNKMYSLCVKAGVCKEPPYKSSASRSSYYGNAEFDNYPVINLDWNMAKTYCEWTGRRLPAEAEWEKAARGTDGRTYPWGNDAPNANLLNYNSNVGDTTEVGKYPSGASVYGALDMAGNVIEWVADSYDVDPGSEPNPNDNFGQIFRVLRGGAWIGGEWINNDIVVRSAYRGWVDQSFTYNYIGFRCALSQ